MKLFQKQLVTGLIIMTGATYAQATTPVPLVFAQTYVSAGAEATFGGDIVATTYFVGGAVTGVTGNIQAGTAITLGASSTSSATTSSGTATTLGAGVVVDGNANYGTALTLGASASSNGSTNFGQTMSYASSQVTTARGGFSILDTDPSATATEDLNWVTNHLISTMDVDTTLDPQSGNDNHGVDGYGFEQSTKVLTLSGTDTVVYNLASLTTGANVTLTLTCGVDYVFNIEDMLSLGAGTEIKMTTGCTDIDSVTWNLGGYASVGEDAVMIGDVLANGYISTGVNSKMNGQLHSETSYVTIGASGQAN